MLVLAPATTRDTFTELVSLTVTLIERDVFSANPAAFTVTVYAPGNKSGTRKTPSCVVVTDRETWVASLTASTSAFDTTRLDGSYTTPEIAPVPGVWPKVTHTSKRKNIAVAAKYFCIRAVFLESRRRFLFELFG